MTEKENGKNKKIKPWKQEQEEQGGAGEDPKIRLK